MEKESVFSFSSYVKRERESVFSIFVERDRKRERESLLFLFLCRERVSSPSLSIYMHIYMKRERKRERNIERQIVVSCLCKDRQRKRGSSLWLCKETERESLLFLFVCGEREVERVSSRSLNTKVDIGTSGSRVPVRVFL